MRVRLAAAGVQGTGTRPWVAERTERLSVQDGGRGSRCTRKEGCAGPRGGSVGVGRTWRRGSPSPCWQSPGRDGQALWTEAGEPKVAARSPSLTCEFLGETHQLCGCLRSGQPPCGRRTLPTHARSLGDPGERLLWTRAVSPVYWEGQSPLTCVGEGGLGVGTCVSCWGPFARCCESSCGVAEAERL